MLDVQVVVMLCKAVIFKCLHDGPFGWLEGSSTVVKFLTVYLAGKTAAASHAREDLTRRVPCSVKGQNIAVVNVLRVPRISHEAGCVTA